MIRKIVKYLLQILTLPLQRVVRRLPRSERIWLFGAWFGHRFSDNPKYLFLYTLEHGTHVKPVWVSRNPAVVAEVRKAGGAAFWMYSLRGIYYQLRAGVAIVSVSLDDVGPVLTAGARVVQLWHGTPLKRIGKDDDRFEGRESGLKRVVWRLRNLLLQREWATYALFPAASEESREKFSRAFRIPVGRVPILGYPRNDVFFAGRDAELREELGEVLGRSLPPRSPIIAYLPTHRKEGRAALAPFPFGDFDGAALERFLGEHDAILIYKAHYYHRQAASDHVVEDSRIVVPRGDVDTQVVLACTDILVTDLSSCYFDFLLRERPIVFLSAGLAEYMAEERNLYYRYEDVTPGRHVESFSDFLEALRDYLRDPQIDRERRREVNWRFNSHLHGGASERVYRHITSNLLRRP